MDEFAHTPGPAVVASDFGLGYGVLEGVEIEELAVAVDNIADEAVFDSVDFDEV